MEIKDVMEKIKPFIAFFILVLLIVSTTNLIKYNKLQKEIATTCEWRDEDVRCFCSQSDVIRMENEVNDLNPNISWSGE